MANDIGRGLERCECQGISLILGEYACCRMDSCAQFT